MNLAARGMTAEPRVEPVVLNTMLEHHSNDLPWRYQPGLTLQRIPVDTSGFIDLALVEPNLKHLISYSSTGGSVSPGWRSAVLQMFWAPATTCRSG